MPHVPDLPSLPWHEFVADDARYDAALRTARRRVRRSAAASSSALAVVAALVVGGSGTPSLTGVAPARGLDGSGGEQPPWERPPAYAPAATATATATPSPSPTPDPVPTVLPTTRAPRPTKSPPPRTAPAPEPTREPAPEPTQPRPTFYEDLRHTGYALRAGAAPAQCRQPHAIADDDRDNAPDRVDEKWCVRYVGPDTYERGTGGAFAIQLCRASDGDDTTLTRKDSDAAYWHSLSIGTATEGHLGTGSDPRDSPIAIGAGDCAEWAFTWQADATPGTYTVKPWFYVWEFNYGECACPEGPPEPVFEIVVR